LDIQQKLQAALQQPWQQQQQQPLRLLPRQQQ
jgi:hypothetical protein